MKYVVTFKGTEKKQKIVESDNFYLDGDYFIFYRQGGEDEAVNLYTFNASIVSFIRPFFNKEEE